MKHIGEAQRRTAEMKTQYGNCKDVTSFSSFLLSRPDHAEIACVAVHPTYRRAVSAQHLRHSQHCTGHILYSHCDL